MLVRLDVKPKIFLWVNPEKTDNTLQKSSNYRHLNNFFFLASKLQLEAEIGIKWPDQNLTSAAGAKYKTLDACM